MDKIIAVTGGIGSGKSEIIKVLDSFGYNTLSCDKITDSLYKKRKTLKKLKKIFPSAIKGKVFLSADKMEISKIAFSDEKKYNELTDYLTELTFNKMIKKAKRKSGKVFVEVPLLFERNYQDKFDNVIVIKRNLNKRIESVIERSNLSKSQVIDRINRQFDYDNADLSKYVLIESDESLQSLKEKVNIIAKEI